LASPPGDLRQRRRRSRDDRAAGLVGQRLHDAPGEAHAPGVLALVAAVRLRPRAPRLHRVGERLVRVDRVGRMRVRAGDAVQHPAGALARAQRQRRARAAAVGLELAVAAQKQPLGPAERRDRAVRRDEPRHGQAVLQARHELDLELDVAAERLDRAHERVRHVKAELVAARAGGERLRVGQPQGPARGAHRRLEHERAVEVAAL
jgi:hypothetical protein